MKDFCVAVTNDKDFYIFTASLNIFFAHIFSDKMKMLSGWNELKRDIQPFFVQLLLRQTNDSHFAFFTVPFEFFSPVMVLEMVADHKSFFTTTFRASIWSFLSMTTLVFLKVWPVDKQKRFKERQITPKDVKKC